MDEVIGKFGEREWEIWGKRMENLEISWKGLIFNDLSLYRGRVV